MPELAEVERAKNDCKLAVEGKTVAQVLTREDTIVYGNCSHTEFADAVRGKKIARVGRLGKCFYLVMQSAPHVVLHLGMSGFVATRGKEPLFYRKKAKNWKNDDGSDWPLRYWKFALKTQEDGQEWCFCDSRRLGRIKLVWPKEGQDITECEPLSLLGRDPYLDMPTLDELRPLLLKRKAPIKAVLLDQNGPFCGLGNWLVDEILFQSTIHPSQRSNTLNETQLSELHKQIVEIINTAVKHNADHKLFPKSWLFNYRWGKGRREHPRTFQLPDGSTATVTHLTVGGRTSAIVESVQKLLGEPASDDEESEIKLEAGEEGEALDHDDDDDGPERKKGRTAARTKSDSKRQSAETPGAIAGKQSKRRRGPKSTAKAQKKDSEEESDLTPAAESDEDTSRHAKTEPDVVEPAVQITAVSRTKAVKGRRARQTEAIIEPVKQTEGSSKTTRRPRRSRTAPNSESLEDID